MLKLHNLRENRVETDSLDGRALTNEHRRSSRYSPKKIILNWILYKFIEIYKPIIYRVVAYKFIILKLTIFHNLSH